MKRTYDGVPEIARRLLAEFVGTLALVFAGCGAIMVNATSGGELGQVGIAISFGLGITPRWAMG